MPERLLMYDEENMVTTTQNILKILGVDVTLDHLTDLHAAKDIMCNREHSGIIVDPFVSYSFINGSEKVMVERGNLIKQLNRFGIPVIVATCYMTGELHKFFRLEPSDYYTYHFKPWNAENFAADIKRLLEDARTQKAMRQNYDYLDNL